ncbi:MAG: hypothetical protein LBB75_09460 [Oscillospiraceae bacterium]|jgi:hypothetical protein|nr:hypothetical protein [Oscillospiraceae bacterium]
MKRIIMLLLALFLLLSACGRIVPDPIPETTSETTATEVPATQAPETRPDPTEENSAETGRYLFYRHEYPPGKIGGNYYIWLPNNMSIDDSVIMDMEFAGFPDSPNFPPEPPRKVGEFLHVHELAPGETQEDVERADYQNTEYAWECLDSGEFTGQQGNRIYYQVMTGGENGSCRYHFSIMLDETRAARLYLWNSVYTPEVDLPRFSKIAASVKL